MFFARAENLRALPESVYGSSPTTSGVFRCPEFSPRRQSCRSRGRERFEPEIFYKELLFYTFDKLGAQAIGFPVNALHNGLMAAITLTIVASMQTVGVVLVISLLVGPGITAYLLVKELHQVMGLGAIIGILATVIGVYTSYYFNIPSGPTIALVIFGLFLLVLLFSPSQGILTRPEMTNRSRRIFRQLRGLREGD